MSPISCWGCRTPSPVGTSNNYLFANNYSFFFEDSWRIASRLTLTLGLRYELPLPPHDKYGRWTSFVPELGKLVIASDATLLDTGIAFSDPTKVTTAKQAGLPSSLVYPDYKDFAPRLGLAWRPFGGNRMVLRGGYGIFYGTQEYNDVRNALANVFPFIISETINRNASQPDCVTLSNPFPVLPSLTNNVVNVNGFELHAPTPYLQSWNLTAERDLRRRVGHRDQLHRFRGRIWRGISISISRSSRLPQPPTFSRSVSGVEHHQLLRILFELHLQRRQRHLAAPLLPRLVLSGELYLFQVNRRRFAATGIGRRRILWRAECPRFQRRPGTVGF